jgi:tetratricopeptide (TPR) repeat protein
VYGFKHPLTQEVALRSQLASRRAERHAATARALEALAAPEKLDECAALLAHHWQEAGEKLVAARWHARAASRLGFFAGPVVGHHWSAVRALCDALPDSAETLTLGIGARAGLIFFGMLASEVGTSEIEGFRDEARSLVARGGDPRALSGVLLAYSFFRSVADVDLEEALLSITEAEQIADQNADEVQRQSMRIFRLITEREGGHLQEAIVTAGQLDPTAPGLTTFERVNWLMNRGRLWFYLGRLGEAQQEIDSAVEIQAREATINHASLWFRVELAEVHGDPASAARDAARAVESSSRDSVHDQRSGSFIFGIARTMAGAWAEAATSFLHTRSLPHGFCSEEVRHRLAEAKLELGEPELAREMASAAASDFARRGMRMHEIPAQLVFARIMMRTNALAARDEITVALERAEVLIHQTGARVFSPRLHAERAAFAWLLGDEAGRTRELREAERLFREIGAPLRADAIAREIDNAIVAPE